MIKIPFNKPYLSGKETQYIQEAVNSGKISGDGMFTKKCHAFFEERYGFLKCLLTTSCTDALEMAALLLNIQPGDEVIIPSFTFVSTANAFVLRGAQIVFADSEASTPNIDIAKIEALITPQTKAIVIVHYAGVACDMDALMALAEKHQLFVVEDAAQGIESFYKDSFKNNRPLGSIGHLAAFSFHETKNIISGEGGMLVINDERFVQRAEVIREKGTNRSAFFRGEVAKYNWVDLGSSFLPSEIISAFLFAQLENLERIQERRLALWNRYHQAFEKLEQTGWVKRPFIPDYASNNAHMYYLLCNDLESRTQLIAHLKQQGILAVFHYLSLHESPFYQEKHKGHKLPYCDNYADCLIRLPLFFELKEDEQGLVIAQIKGFFDL